MTDEVAEPGELEISETKGAIKGVVTDDSLEPQPNVVVILETTSAKPEQLATGSSDAAGAFGFSLLDPGAYRVRAESTRFNEVATIVQVIAGEVASTRLQLTLRPVELPYVEVRIFNGIAGCDSWGFIVTFAVIGSICPTQQPNSNGYPANYTASWRHIVWEMDWASPDELIALTISPGVFTCDTEACYGVWHGPPGVRLEAKPGQKMQNDTSFYNAPTGSIIPYPDGAFETSVFTYYGGNLGRETTEAMKPTGYCPEYCYGVASTLEIRFAIYESVFHNEAPQDPGQYSVIPDS